MFTGIIKDVGSVIALSNNEDGVLIEIQTDLVSDIKVDDSISVNGVCLTAIAVKENSFVAQVVPMTLSKTNFSKLKISSKVNLELALKLSDRLGGHIVLGHVNCLGILENIKKNNESYEIEISLPVDYQKYLIPEGSIAINGISLTLAKVQNNIITLALIPHTWANTQISEVKISEEVNIEVDSTTVTMINQMEKLFASYLHKKGLSNESI